MCNKTALYDQHLQLGAKMVEFAGWKMPLHYPKGSVKEHLAVREYLGLFDVSHMGCIEVTGEDTEALLEWLSTNYVEGKPNGTVTYTVWCNSKGGAVDDLLLFKIEARRYFVIVNASNRQKDLDHLEREAKQYRVSITSHYDDKAILALQGPEALEYLPECKLLKPMHCVFLEDDLLLSRTGYTGEKGFELIIPQRDATKWWETLIKKGAEPCGLGARDSLRLEMGYALYGHELSEEIFPTESVAAWAVKLKKESFVGKEALVALEKSSKKRAQFAIVLEGRRIAREKDPLFFEGKLFGRVLSGGYSPSIQRPIAVAMGEYKLEKGQQCEVEIRGSKQRASVR